MNLQFDPSISLGTLLHLAGMVLAIAVAYTRLVTRLSRLEEKINIMWTWFSRRAFNGAQRPLPPGCPFHPDDPAPPKS